MKIEDFLSHLQDFSTKRATQSKEDGREDKVRYYMRMSTELSQMKDSYDSSVFDRRFEVEARNLIHSLDYKVSTEAGSITKSSCIVEISKHARKIVKKETGIEVPNVTKNHVSSAEEEKI